MRKKTRRGSQRFVVLSQIDNGMCHEHDNYQICAYHLGMCGLLILLLLSCPPCVPVIEGARVVVSDVPVIEGARVVVSERAVRVSDLTLA